MSAIYLDLDASKLELLAKEFDATDDLFRRAYLSALSKSGRWLMSKSSRELRRELRVPAKIFRKRMRKFRLRRTAGGESRFDELRVWYGLDPIPLSDLRPHETRAGVTAGPAKVKGAFMAPNLAGKMDVFKRRSDKRLPLDRQTLEIKDDVNQIIEDRIFPDFERKFYQLFEHELSWRTQKQR